MISLKKSNIDVFMTKHKYFWVYGATIPEKTLIRYFKIETPSFALSLDRIHKDLNRFTLQKLAVQCRLNTELAPKGLYLKQQGKQYRILTAEETINKVVNYQKGAKIKTACANRLQKGINNGKGQWI